MAARKVLTYGEKCAYDLVVGALEAACANANCGTLKWTRLADRFKNGSGHMTTVSGLLHLKGWTWRGAKKDESLSILLEVDETIDCESRSVVKSVVRADYYVVRGEDARLVQCTHYDFDGEKENHPVFHAQCRKDPISLTSSERTELEFSYGVSSDHMECFGAARFPTSDMTFSSVLLCLAADHFKRSVFCEFRDSMAALQAKLPHPQYAALAASLGVKSKHLRSAHWYSHMKTN